MPKVVKRPDREAYYAWITDPITKRKRRRGLKATNRRTATVVAEGLERQAYLSPNSTGQTSFETACESFLTQHVARKAAGTQDMYQKKLRVLLTLIGPRTPLARIDAESVDKFTATRLKQGIKKSTIGKELTALRGVLKLARRQKKYPYGLDEVLPSWSSASTPKERWCTPEETWLIINQLRPRRGAVVAYHVATGSNYAECMRAHPEDVQGEDVFLRGTKRDSRRRKAPVYPWGIPFLEYATKHGGHVKGKRMFDNWSGMRWDLLRVCTRLEIQGVTSNDLRSSYGMWLRLRGVSPTLIGTAMGHADGRMAERRYAKVPVDKLRSLIDMELRQSQDGPTDENTAKTAVSEPMHVD